MKNEIKAIIDKAERSLKSADHEFRQGNYDFACSRAYFAVIHMLQGVLLHDGHPYIYHRDIITVLNNQYVKKKVFDSELLKHIKYLVKRRELSDFSFSLTIYSQEVEQCILRAKIVNSSLSAYLIDKIFKIED